MRRLFTFGCSFTNYWRWPTWADILAQQYDHAENWAICGGGNAQILYNLMECNQRNHITQDDTVMIMWTNTSREDRYVGSRWIEGGNIYWSAGSELPEDYVKKFACERGYLIRDLAVISAVRRILHDWDCGYSMFSMVPLRQSNQANGLGDNPSDRGRYLDDVFALYADVIDGIAPSVYETVFDSNWFSGEGVPDLYDPGRRDFHPTPMEHLKYLDTVGAGHGIKDNTRDWVTRVDQQLKRGEQLQWHRLVPQNRL